MSSLETVETVTEVEYHGRRWGHEWAASATIYAEHDPLGTWKVTRRYHAIPGPDGGVPLRRDQLKVVTSGVHLNTQSTYHGTADWQPLPVDEDALSGPDDPLVAWISEHCRDGLEDLLDRYAERVIACETCGRTVNVQTGRQLAIRQDRDGTPRLCDDCYDNTDD
ncbi:hypothetical protein [Haloarchaeobius sp. HRN-SO-5]|uniref:hypothetical protein n=1 Tax=Haloarchaeobius sp. HRN-SO-5 TaxID=3446118 RepID=UPI003EBE5901